MRLASSPHARRRASSDGTGGSWSLTVVPEPPGTRSDTGTRHEPGRDVTHSAPGRRQSPTVSRCSLTTSQYRRRQVPPAAAVDRRPAAPVGGGPAGRPAAAITDHLLARAGRPDAASRPTCRCRPNRWTVGLPDRLALGPGCWSRPSPAPRPLDWCEYPRSGPPAGRWASTSRPAHDWARTRSRRRTRSWCRRWRSTGTGTGWAAAAATTTAPSRCCAAAAAAPAELPARIAAGLTTTNCWIDVPADDLRPAGLGGGDPGGGLTERPLTPASAVTTWAAAVGRYLRRRRVREHHRIWQSAVFECQNR